jgi:GntR family transcriptional regulator/MocR family aminotransferase
MDFHISLDGRGDLTARIYSALRDAIRDGQLQPGDRLPPTRELARSLTVSRNTVALAYERLTAEGFLVGRVGAGTYVAAESATVRRRREPPAAGLHPRVGWTFEPTITSSEQESPRYDFRVGIPDPELFPFDTWRRLLTSELRLRANNPGTYAEPAGLPGLRQAIARYVGYARSVRAEADDIVITNGTQQALDLIGRVLLSPGDVVAVEDPGYPPARDLFASLGARVVGVPVDGEGLIVDGLPVKARLVYVTPSHQFPLGTPMSLVRRRMLLAWAARRGAAIVEDDYDSEFRFSARPLDPLQSLDTSGRVLYVGTFSKTLLPGLRIGFVVAPPTLRSALRAAKQLSDSHGQIATQAALTRFMDEGQLARHIRKASRVYAARHHAVVAAINDDLADLLTLIPSSAGLHVCARLRDGRLAVADRVVEQAAEQGLVVESLAAYYRDLEPEAGFVLGYGAVRSSTMHEGLSVFAATLRRVANAS